MIKFHTLETISYSPDSLESRTIDAYRMSWRRSSAGPASLGSLPCLHRFQGRQRLDVIDMPAEPRVVIAPHHEFDRRDDRRCGDVAERVLRKLRNVDHERDSAAGPDEHRRAAARDRCDSPLHRIRELDGIFSHSGPQRAPGPAHEKHRAHSRLAVLADAFARRTKS